MGTVSILLYSGVNNQEKELTPEEDVELKKLIYSLFKPSPVEYNPQIGFGGYSASWEDLMIIACSGVVVVYSKHEFRPKYFIDDRGIQNKIKKILENK